LHFASALSLGSAVWVGGPLDFRLEEVASIFRGYGLEGHELDHVTNAIAADPKRWVDAIMQFELGLDPRNPKRAPISVLTMRSGMSSAA
jgi:VIT family protein